MRRVLRAHWGLGEGARYERYLRRDLILALRLAREAREIPSEVRRPLLDQARRALIRKGGPSARKVALISVLSTLPADDAIPALQEALRNEDADVRQAAAWALGEIGDPQAVPALQEALKDEDADVRRAAAEALGEIARALRPAAEEKERRKQVVLLSRVARRRTDVYDALQAVLEKLEALTAPYFDPFAPLPVPLAVRLAPTLGLGLTALFLLAALAPLVLLSGAVGDLLKEWMKASLRGIQPGR